MPARKSRKRKPSGETIQDMVHRILNEVEDVTINGIRQKLTNLEILLRQLQFASMKGDQKARKLLLDLRKYHLDAEDPGLEILYATKRDPKT
jgi:Family of unknown function (DUF5681)